jgi:hypothetical protein
MLQAVQVETQAKQQGLERLGAERATGRAVAVFKFKRRFVYGELAVRNIPTNIYQGYLQADFGQAFVRSASGRFGSYDDGIKNRVWRNLHATLFRATDDPQK